MKLFYKPGACSLASHITLRESGIDFTLDGVDLAKKRLENGDDYFAVNPKGQVPALMLDDGTLLTEGVAIMQYLADSVPDVELGRSGLASQLQSLVHIICLSRIDQLCSVDIVLAMFHCISSCVVMRAVLCPPTVYVSALDGDTHGTAGAANHAACSFQRSSVQVGHLGLGDLFHLSGGQRSDLFLVGLAGSGVDASCLLDQNGCRRSLGDEAEGAVSIHSDDDGDHITHLVLGTLVELLGECHDVDTLLTQSRANRGSRSCLAGLDLQLNVASNFLCHNKCTSKNLW